jgi:protein-disulfide isomerase
MKLRRLALVIIAFGILFSNSAIAGSKKKTTPPAVVQPPTITAVTANSVTIKEEKATKTLTVDQFTEINVNGRKATAAELKPGMIVNVTLGTDPTKASRVNATSK